MMQVAQLMRRDVVTIEDDRTCRDAVERMSLAKVRHLPVVDRDGTIAGMVTDRDLRHWLFAPDIYRRVGRVPATTLLREAPVSEVMSAPALTIAPTADVSEAVQRMRAAKIGSLVVVEARRVVGILTEIDVLRHVMSSEAPTGSALDVVVS
jgi:CBS domain-containing membrane protein